MYEHDMKMFEYQMFLKKECLPKYKVITIFLPIVQILTALNVLRKLILEKLLSLCSCYKK